LFAIVFFRCHVFVVVFLFFFGMCFAQFGSYFSKKNAFFSCFSPPT
jgi:hypothetical protein